MFSNQTKINISVEALSAVIRNASHLNNISASQISQPDTDTPTIFLISRLLDTISKQAGNIDRTSFNSSTPVRIITDSITLQIDFLSLLEITSSGTTTMNINFPITRDEDGSFIKIIDTASIPISILASIATEDTFVTVISYVIRVDTNLSEPLRARQIASNVFGLNILGIAQGERLGDPILISFQTSRIIDNPICSFLRLTDYVWSQFGVELKLSSENRTICKTNHLTNFAVLAGSKSQNTNTERLALQIVSYILLAISLIFLLYSLFLFLYSAKKVFKVEGNIMYFNYGVALTVAISTFIVGAELHNLQPPVGPILCTIVSFFIHYVWLVVFTSSTALSILIFYATWLSGIHSERTFIAHYLIIGAWSIPLVITIAISIPILILENDIIYRHSFLTNDSCILSPMNKFTIPFYALIDIMIIFNVIILILTLVKIYKALRKQLPTNPSNVSKLRIYRIMAISALILLPILGVSWVIVPLIAHTPLPRDLASFLDWIFISLNSTSGIPFFIAIRRIEEIKNPFPIFKKYELSNKLTSNGKSSTMKKYNVSITKQINRPVSHCTDRINGVSRAPFSSTAETSLIISNFSYITSTTNMTTTTPATPTITNTQ